MLDDPGILWSKALDTGNPRGNNLARPVSNGYPGMHPFRRQAEPQSTAAVSSAEKLKESSSIESSHEEVNSGTRTKELLPVSEPLADDITITMTEGTHRVNPSSGLTNCIKQRKTRVSELSIIDVNDPLPTHCANSLLEHNTEKKKRDSRIQETNRQYKHGQIQGVNKRDERQSQQSRHSGTKTRQSETTGGSTRKQTHSHQDSDNSHMKAVPSQYYNKRRKDYTSGSVG